MLNSLSLLKLVGSKDTQYFAGLHASEHGKQISVLCNWKCSLPSTSWLCSHISVCL